MKRVERLDRFFRENNERIQSALFSFFLAGMAGGILGFFVALANSTPPGLQGWPWIPGVACISLLIPGAFWSVYFYAAVADWRDERKQPSTPEV